MDNLAGKRVVSICSNPICKYMTLDLCGRPCLQCGSSTFWYCRECYTPITNPLAHYCSVCGSPLKNIF